MSLGIHYNGSKNIYAKQKCDALSSNKWLMDLLVWKLKNEHAAITRAKQISSTDVINLLLEYGAKG